MEVSTWLTIGSGSSEYSRVTLTVNMKIRSVLFCTAFHTLLDYVFRDKFNQFQEVPANLRGL